MANKTPTSPEETNDGNSKQDGNEEINLSWVYGPLPGYGKLIGYQGTLSSILFHFTEHPPTHSLIVSVIPLPRDVEAFVKALQSMELKMTFSVWTDSQFVDCSYEFHYIYHSIIQHTYYRVMKHRACRVA